MSGGKMMENIEESGYKYLRILKADVRQKSQKYTKVKVNGENIISAINSRAVSVVRYRARVIIWTKMELEELDQKTRKLMTMHLLVECTCRDVREGEA